MRNKPSKIPDFVLYCMVSCIVLIGSSCTFKNRKNDQIVAKVGDKYLYFSEMSNVFPVRCSKDDSLALARFYIDNWIKTKLLLKKAELNLSKEQLNITDEIETYRTSLLIYKYEDLLLREKLDTAVLESEIQTYYEANEANFLSEEYVVKAVYIKLPANAPALWNVRRWYLSDVEKDIQDMADYCRDHAVEYELFDDEWVQWVIIENELPRKEAATKRLTQYDYMEQQDEDFIYFVRIREKRAPDDIAPLALVRDKVKSIIINKRKLNFISELERNIYDDALTKNQFEIFKIN